MEMEKDDWKTPIDFARLSKDLSSWKGDAEYKDCVLLKHYPYIDNALYHGGLYGDVDLLKPPARWFQNMKTKDQLVCSILEDVARAMHYVVVWHPQKPWERQAFEAFAMWSLLSYGVHKKITFSEIVDPEKEAEKEVKERYNRKHYNKSFDRKEMERLTIASWKESGRVVLEHKPLRHFSVKQLRAISVIVGDSFENMC